MTPEQWFRLGVLAHLKEAGLNPAEQIALVENYGKLRKQAVISFDAKIDPLGVISKLISDWGPLGVAGAVAAPVAAGAAGGYSLAHLTDTDNRDIDDLKRQALIRQYRQHKQLLRNELNRYDQRRG